MSARGGGGGGAGAIAGSKLEMYRLEHPAFRRAAYRPGLCDELWAEIDGIVSAAPRET